MRPPPLSGLVQQRFDFAHELLLGLDLLEGPDIGGDDGDDDDDDEVGRGIYLAVGFGPQKCGVTPTMPHPKWKFASDNFAE